MNGFCLFYFVVSIIVSRLSVNKWRMAGKNLLVASIVLVVLSLVCEIVGYVSSGWEIIYYQSTWTEIFIDMHFGLWYTCTPDGCESGAKDEGSVCKYTYASTILI